MEFNPISTIYLCNVPIDNSYKNQIYFSNVNKQQEYFRSKVVKTFTNYLTVRKTLPDGSLQSSIKVDCGIDQLRTIGCNYLYYQNEHHGNKIFYAFINKMIYINEGTTELIFECDVYQTWLFNVELKASYVVREHAVKDIVGLNIVPEKFSFQDYDYEHLHYPAKNYIWNHYVCQIFENWTSKTLPNRKYISHFLYNSDVPNQRNLLHNPIPFHLHNS